MILVTERLQLRRLEPSDADALAALHADAEAMADAGRPIGRAKSDLKLSRYIDHFERHGFGHWAVSAEGCGFIGYVGVGTAPGDHPLGAHHAAGWRFLPSAWGFGYAREAALVMLESTFARFQVQRILAYTGPANVRSRALMARLGLSRRPELDFGLDEGRRLSTWLTWAAERADFQHGAMAD